MQQFHHLNVGIYASVKDAKGVEDIGLWASMVLLNCQNFIEMTSNMISIVALGVVFKCPCKIHLNTQCLEVRHHSTATKVVYMCSSLFQLAPGSRDLSQAEKRMSFKCKAEQFTK